MRFVILLAALFAALASADPARADLWGYVDDTGKPHFATEQVDARYQLFYRGPTSLDPRPKPVPDAALESVRDSVLYRRVAAHPNVARYAALIEQQAKAHALDPALVKAVIAVESGFETTALSDKGAVGLMQVIPATGERYGLAPDRLRTVEDKLRDPATNVRIGTQYLRDLLARFGDDLSLALAAYNAGEGAVEAHDLAVPPYPETRAYVTLVQAFYTLYRPPPPPDPPPARVTLPRTRPAR